MGLKKTFFHRFLVVSFEAIEQVLFALPRYPFFNSIKALFLRSVGAKIGKRVIFYPRVWITPGKGLIVGNDVDLALGVLIESGGGVEIGDRTLIGYGTQIHSVNHVIPSNRGAIFLSGHEKKQVIIGKDVWVGGNCMILPGVNIGEGAVVAGGSVVIKDVLPFTIVGGCPARVIKTRD